MEVKKTVGIRMFYVGKSISGSLLKAGSLNILSIVPSKKSAATTRVSGVSPQSSDRRGHRVGVHRMWTRCLRSADFTEKEGCIESW